MFQAALLLLSKAQDTVWAAETLKLPFPGIQLGHYSVYIGASRCAVLLPVGRPLSLFTHFFTFFFRFYRATFFDLNGHLQALIHVS
jgi:hypothetical protein